jgi:hypothetical protein
VAQNGSPKTAPLTLFVRIGLGGAVLATTNPLRRMTGRECASDAIAEAQDRVGLGLGREAAGVRRQQQAAVLWCSGAMRCAGREADGAYPGGDCTARRRQARQTRTSVGRGDVGHGTSDMGHGWAHVHARSSRNRYARDAAATQRRSRAGPGSWPGLVWPGCAARSAQLHSWLAMSLMMRTRGPNGSLTATVCWLRTVQVRVCVCVSVCVVWYLTATATATATAVVSLRWCPSLLMLGWGGLAVSRRRR